MIPSHSTPLARFIAAASASDAQEATGAVKNRSRGACGVAVLALLLSAAVVQAGVTITSVVNGSSAPVLDSSFGTMDLAFNLGQTGGGTVVRDGITFTNNGVTGTTSVVYGTASGITVTGSTTVAGIAISNDALGGDTLYNTETYTANNNPMTLVLTGLDPLRAYRIQMMHGEPRNYTYNNGAITATESLANVATGSLTFGPSGSANQYALVTIEVSGSTSLSHFMPTAGRGPSFSGIVVQSRLLANPLGVDTYLLDGKKVGGLTYISGNAVESPGGLGWRMFQLRQGTTVVAQAAGDFVALAPETAYLIWRKPNGQLAPRWTDLFTGSGPFTLKMVGIAASGTVVESAPFTFTLQNTARLTITSADVFPRYKSVNPPAATTITAVATGTSGTATLSWSAPVVTTTGTTGSVSNIINTPGLNLIRCVAKDTSGNRVVEAFVAPVAVRDRVGNGEGDASMDFQGVDVTSGNLQLPSVDMTMPAIGVPFSLARAYNSYPASVFDLTTIPTVGRWMFGFEQSLAHNHLNSQEDIFFRYPTVDLKRADGSTVQFFPGMDGYYHPSTPGVHDLLDEDFNAGTFTLYQAATSPLVTVFETTDQNTRANSRYRLKSIKNLRGHGLTVNYTTSNGTKISTVTDQSGRAYTFYYTDADAPTRISRVSDFSGRNVYYNWDANGNLSTVTDVRGFVTTYGYGTTGNQTKRLQYVQLPGGNRPISDITYDAGRRVETITMPLGTSSSGTAISGTTTFSYLTTRTDISRPGTGNNLRYETDLDRNVFAVVESYGVANRRTDFVRFTPADLAGQANRTSDLGLTTRSTTGNLAPTDLAYATNGRGLVKQITNGSGTTAVIYPNAVLNAAPGTLPQNLALPTSITDPRGKTSTPQFTSTGELSAILNPYSQGGKITEFDAATGNPKTIDDGRGNITEFQYTATGDLWKIIVPDPYNSSQRTTTFSYPTGTANRGLPTTVTDRKGYQTTIEWDAAGNPTLIRAVDLTPLAGESKDIVMAYDSNGNRTSVTDRRSQTTNFDFDNMDRPWRVRMPSPDGAAARPTVTTEYDTLGRATKVTNPNGHATEQVYGTSGTGAGLVQSVRAYKPGGTYDTIQAITYLADGRTNTVTDGESIVRTTVYYSSPRQHLVHRITEPAPGGYLNFKEFDYDAAESPVRDTTGTTDPAFTRPLPSTLYTYDDAGRLSTVINVMNGNWSNPNDAAHIRTQVTYYGDDNIDVITDPRGQPIKHIYTTTGQLETRRDALNNEWTYRYDANGNPTQEIFPGNGSYPSRTITRSFGPLDRLLSINYGDGLNTNVSYSYDANGNRLSMSDRQGATAYAYDLLNRLTSMTHTPDGRSGLSLSYAYWPGGQLKTLTYPGSRAVSYGYDHMDRMSSVTPWTGGAFGYTWRKNGQLDLLTNPNGTQTDYQYNHPGGRLSGLVTIRSGTTIANQQFTTDPAGNITRITGEQPLAPPGDATHAMTPDNANRLATIQGQAVTNDPAGRSHALPAPISATTTWEGMDWLASYTTGGQTSSYGYNGDGVRTHATRSGATTRYLIDPNAALPNVTAECNDANSPQRFYVHGIGLLASIDTSNNVQTYHANHRGDILALTNASGTVTESYGYSPFGLTAASNTSSTNPFRFGGQYGVMDEGNGMSFMRARYYTANNGRFLSMDQFPGDVGNPQSLNRFGYAFGNPFRYIDISGKNAKDIKNISNLLTKTYKFNSKAANNLANGMMSGMEDGESSGIIESILGSEETLVSYLMETASLKTIFYRSYSFGTNLYDAAKNFLAVSIYIDVITLEAMKLKLDDLDALIKTGNSYSSPDAATIHNVVCGNSTNKGVNKIWHNTQIAYELEQFAYQSAKQYYQDHPEVTNRLEDISKGMLVEKRQKGFKRLQLGKYYYEPAK